MTKMKEDNGVFFVGIGSSADLRRNILESVKDCIENLQTYEKLKEIRDEKVICTAKLRGLLRDISGLVNDMKDELPKTGLKAKPRPKEMKQEVKEAEKSERKMIAKPQRASELDKLDRELRAIESKLNALA